jgi:hypothetical protein
MKRYIKGFCMAKMIYETTHQRLLHYKTDYLDDAPVAFAWQID